MSEQTLHHFYLILGGVTFDTPNLEDALFEAGCDDALLQSINNTVMLEFDRQAPNLKTAILSAISNVESADIDVYVASIAPEHLVGLSDIAERINATRQSVSLMAQGKRLKGNFPTPIFKLNNKSTLWRWTDVISWLKKQGKLQNTHLLEEAIFIEDLNVALELREPDARKRRTQLAKTLGPIRCNSISPHI